MSKAQGIAQSANQGQFKNRIINGAMVIDQRNAGASVTVNDGTFGVDRFVLLASQSSKLTVQRNAGSVTPPIGFTNYLGYTSSSAYSINSGDYFFIQQNIEGFNIADLGWGTANAQTVTLSFYVRSSLTGTFGGVFTNSDFNRSFPYTYTISTANTWEQKTITLAGDTTGTWNTNNAGGIRVCFGLGVGSTLSGAAGSWSANQYFSATGGQSVVGTNGATFYITGVQLEKGSTATSFDYRPYGTELALCQRYYELLGTGRYVGRALSTTGTEGVLSFVVPKRSTPTVTLINGTNTLVEIGVSIRSFTAISTGGAGTTGIYVSVTGSSGLTSPNMVVFYNNDSIASASAEL